MIRGGGPEAWRHLDLADEAQSKPSPLPILPPSSAPFFPLFSTRDPLVARDPFTSPSPSSRILPTTSSPAGHRWILLSLDLRTSSSAIALPRSTNLLFSFRRFPRDSNDSKTRTKSEMFAV